MLTRWVTLGILVVMVSTSASALPADDEAAVAKLDTEYQAAVARNDAATMDRILADNFVLVLGSGKTFSKADLLEQARSVKTVYERQEDSSQKVRVWGDTAVVTALLWLKGTNEGSPSSGSFGSAMSMCARQTVGGMSSVRPRCLCRRHPD